ncbi:hypothetical protein [Alkalihalobacterium elongatum]|uniref:hypothetical protein n=1 Tax=Alkalihalobacterium elongatum TaxID=2675466 RepID=UPI001C1FEB38|nr:hypothetical protein [Alkalihalobacterium elongatum]
MSDQEFERSLQKLKKVYDQKSNQSSPEELMNYIKSKEKRKLPFLKRVRGLGIAASLVVAIGIGSILLLSQMPENSASDELVSEDQRGSELITFEEGAVPPSINRDSQIVDTLLIEGQEEEIHLKLWADEQLRFSTYIDERFNVEGVSDEKGYKASVYANYTGDQIEPPFFTVYKPSINYQEPLGDYIKRLRDDYESQGFIESTEEFSSTWSSDADLFFLNEEKSMGKAVHLFEINDNIYEITETTFGEYSEGLGARLQLIEQHFQWHE